MKELIAFIVVWLMVNLCYGVCIAEKQQVRNLNAFTKLWGYAKHFYPSDEAQTIDWDRFAVYGIREVRNCKNDRELKSKLNDLFSPIIPDLKLFTKSLIKPEEIATDTTKLKAFWQYSGYENGVQSSLFRSIRANRPLKIFPDDTIPYYWTWICPQIAVDYQRYDSLRVNIQFIQSGSRPDSVSFGVGYGGDTVMEEIGIEGRVTQSYVLHKKSNLELMLWGYLSGFEAILVESLTVEAWNNGSWEPIYLKDFSEDKPGSLPQKLSVNMSPAMGVLSSKVNVLVDTLEGRNVLRISKADPAQEYTLGFIDKIFAEELPWGEWLDKELVPGIRVGFPMVLACDLEHTYPIVDSLKLQALKDDCASIDLTDRADPAIWFAGIVKIWNTLNFFYPYFEYDICNWDKELVQTIKRVMQVKDFDGYKLELTRLLSNTQDGHSYLYDDHAYDHTTGFSAIYVEGKWVVGKIINPDVDIPVGSEITHLNGESFKKLMDKYRRIYRSSNPVNTDTWLLGNYIKTYSDSVATFRFITPDRHLVEKIVHLGDFSSYDLRTRGEKTISYPEGIIYLNLFRLHDEDIDSMMPELLKAKGLILDLSFYPRVSTKLLQLLLKEQDTWSSCVVKRYIRPNDELPRIGEDTAVWGLTPEEPHLNAKMVALSSRLAQSYCEGYLGVIKYNKLGTIVGQPSAGANGNVVTTALPGDIRVSWTGLLVQNPGRERFFGLGIIPDVIIERSLEDIVNGNDPEMNSALEILRREISEDMTTP